MIKVTVKRPKANKITNKRHVFYMAAVILQFSQMISVGIGGWVKMSGLPIHVSSPGFMSLALSAPSSVSNVMKAVTGHQISLNYLSLSFEILLSISSIFDPSVPSIFPYQSDVPLSLSKFMIS